MSYDRIIHVAVGVVINRQQEILISQRHIDSHQGSLWEFPGGKKESQESIEAALQREFVEELGIKPIEFFPFAKILHHYAEKTVLLDVWLITQYRGEEIGREGQVIEWCPITDLRPQNFPIANQAIIKKLQTPRKLAITPNIDKSESIRSLFDRYAEMGIQLVQFQQTHLCENDYLSWFDNAQSIAKNHGLRLLYNQSLRGYKDEWNVGFHANSHVLDLLTERPISDQLLFSASCRNLKELQHAEKLAADFVTLYPICPNAKSWKEQVLGWEKFRDLASQVSLPVYALGGLSENDSDIALESGAFGIAGTFAFTC